MQAAVIIGQMVGGLGLFLLAIHMITNGLTQVSGTALRGLLGRWTRTPAHGIVAGMAITAIVQSSSAVTVATIGFVNAGLLNLAHSLGVVYGANIGTTMTGWLVALVGFKIKIEAFALPMIGIGMILRLSGPGFRRGAIGEALAGFGLFFIGVDFLREAFTSLASSIQLPQQAHASVLGLIAYLLFGVLMTVLTQSSSAAIAITLTAATGGLLSLEGAAAMVIGANVGTTTTAIISVIGATPNAKRVAAAHVIFNVLTAVVALVILPLMLWVVQRSSEWLGVSSVIGILLALFHTVFNLLGVIIMLPLSGRLSAFLEKRFTTIEELESRTQFLDKTVLVSPALAINALCLELGRVAAISVRMAKGALSTEVAPGKQMAGDRHAVRKLILQIGDFVTRMERASLPQEIAAQLANVLRTGQYYVAAADMAYSIAQAKTTQPRVTDPALQEALSRFYSNTVKLIQSTDQQQEGFSLGEADDENQALQDEYQAIKLALLDAGTRSRLNIEDMTELLEVNSRIRRMVGQLMKGIHYLNALSVVARLPQEAKPTETPAGEEKPAA